MNMIELILIAILCIMLIIISILLFYFIKRYGNLKKILQQNNDYKRVKNRIIFQLIENPHFLEQQLKQGNYNKIAIYGNNEYADLVIDLLRGTGIEIEYMLVEDWSVTTKNVILLQEAGPEVDATINVTEKDKDSLRDKYKGDYLSFYDLLYHKVSFCK